MSHMNFLMRSVCVFLSIMFSFNALASEFNAREFIESASIASVSEVETAKRALIQSASPEVKAFAEQMIKDQAIVVASLRALAEQEHLTIASEAVLLASASNYIPTRPGQSFDAAYANKRLVERKKVIALYREAVKSGDEGVRNYAVKTLPVFMHDWYLAQNLSQKINGDVSVQVGLSQ